MKSINNKFLIFILYFLAIFFLLWTLWVFLYQYIAALGFLKEVLHGFVNDRILSALWLSLASSFVTVMISILFGIPLAYVFAVKNFPGKTIIETLAIEVPQTFPPISVGLVLLLMLGQNSPFHINLAATFAALVIAQLFVSGSFIVAFAVRKFREIQSSGLDITALTLGASPIQVFWTIYLPLASRDILGGVAICWARAMGELGGSLIFAGAIPFKTEIIPTFIAQNSNVMGPALSASILATTASAFALIVFKIVTPGGGSWKDFFYRK